MRARFGGLKPDDHVTKNSKSRNTYFLRVNNVTFRTNAGLQGGMGRSSSLVRRHKLMIKILEQIVVCRSLSQLRTFLIGNFH